MEASRALGILAICGVVIVAAGAIAIKTYVGSSPDTQTAATAADQGASTTDQGAKSTTTPGDAPECKGKVLNGYGFIADAKYQRFTIAQQRDIGTLWSMGFYSYGPMYSEKSENKVYCYSDVTFRGSVRGSSYDDLTLKDMATDADTPTQENAANSSSGNSGTASIVNSDGAAGVTPTSDASSSAAQPVVPIQPAIAIDPTPAGLEAYAKSVAGKHMPLYVGRRSSTGYFMVEGSKLHFCETGVDDKTGCEKGMAYAQKTAGEVNCIVASEAPSVALGYSLCVSGTAQSLATVKDEKLGKVTTSVSIAAGEPYFSVVSLGETPQMMAIMKLNPSETYEFSR
jgi:hypothetical protein